MNRYTILFILLLIGGYCDAQQEVDSLRIITLDEVVVKGNTPIYSVKSDRVTVNVARTILSQAGTAEDVLRKSVRVAINGNKVVVLGRGEAIVMVDGHRLPSNSSLSSIQSSEIARIEVITSPSAKYDAEGKAVIEITTKGANRFWGAEVTTRIGKGDFWRGYIGAELSAKHKGLSVYGFYAIEPEKTSLDEAFERDYRATPSPKYITNNVRTIDHRLSNNFRFGSEYRFDERHNAGLQVGGQYSNSDLIINDISHISDRLLTSQQWGDGRKQYSSVTAFYDYTTDRMKWSTLIDESLFDHSRNLDIAEHFDGATSQKRLEEQVGIDIMSVRSDLALTLPRSFGLDAGVKITSSRNNSHTLFGTLSDYFYKEQIAAAYLSGRKTYKRFDFEVGVRFEAAMMKARTERLIQDTTAYHLFPTASIKYKINKDWALQAQFATRITRPTFQDLNPAKMYVDTLSYSVGNPYLKPEIRHSIELKAIFMEYASLGVSYTAKRNAHSWYITQDAENPAVTCATQINTDRSDVFTVDLMLPYQNDRLTTYLTTGMIYTITNDRRAEVVSLRQPMWYCYWGIDLNLPWKLKFNTNIGYYTKAAENIFIAEPMFRADAGIQRRFLKDKLNVALAWDDIFHTAHTASYSTMNSRYLHYSFYNDLSVVKLSVSYRFNIQKSGFNSRAERDRERIKGLNVE